MLPPEKTLDDPDIYRVSTADPIQLIQLLAESVPHFIRRFYRIRPDYSIPTSTLQDLSTISLPTSAWGMVFGCALLITLIRYAWEARCQSLVVEMRLCGRYAHKFPESTWKLGYYTISWLLVFAVHFALPEITTFNDPLSMWKGWEEGIAPPTPTLLSLVYVLQAAYYLHSIYATLYMDLWRQDSWLMFTHHFVALALLLLSYVDGFTRPGALILFLHDNSDAALEILAEETMARARTSGGKLLIFQMAKVCLYTKTRSDGRYFRFIHYLGIAIFTTFTITWVVFRMYWFPCKLLYGTLYGAVYLGPQDAPFFPLLGLMLVLIFLMNIYWFNFIVRMCIRVITEGEEPEDNREWDTTATSGLDRQRLDQLAKQHYNKHK